ncbi:hypothetical protein [Salmonella phage vB_SenS_S124]|uniref:Uncharacterized protein n=1 Tax=Salmonella phage vB_SenS_S124 TaxID=2886210 RepID=A0AAE9C242_9CAUD|nr:hypothetical protein [Salmonella phage vB_SenS_S124]
MADFCKQCSIDMWGKDTGDLSGLITEAEVKEGYGAVVICEGCGVIRVDHEGKRLEDSEPIATVPVE